MITDMQKIIVIDDKFDEIKPLLTALGIMGIPSTYLDGLQENLPTRPFLGVRIIFLDIVLGTEGTSDNNQAATVANVVKHIIGEKPNPYFIIFWTKHLESIDNVLRYLSSDNISPIGHLMLDKPTSSNVIKTTKEIIDEIDLKIKDLGVFDYILTWENIIEKASYYFSTSLFPNIPANINQSDWSKRIASLMGTLSLAYTDQNTFSHTESDLRNTFFMMADSFSDSLQQSIKSEQLSYHTELSDKPVSMEQLAKINSSLFFDFNPEKSITFGSVYIDKNPDEHLINSMINDIFKNSKTPVNIELIGMIMTPSCDIAHRKYLHNDKDSFRILYGLLFPLQDMSDYENYFMPDWIQKNKNDLLDELKNKNSDNKYSKIVKQFFKNYPQPQSHFYTKPFWDNIKNIPCLLVFHYGSLTSLWWDNNEIPDFIFLIKQSLAFDIQSKMVNHANRLGNSMLDSR